MMHKLKKLWGLIETWPEQKTYIRWVSKKTKPFIGSLLILLGFQIAGSLLGIGTSLISKRVIDAVTISAGEGFASSMLLMIAATLVSMGLSAFSGRIGPLINERFAFDIRNKVFSHVMRSDWLSVSDLHSGDMITRLTSDVDTVSSGVASVVPGVISLLIRLIAAFAVLCVFDITLAMGALLLAPLGAIISISMGGKLQALQVELKKSESEYRSFLQESVANTLVVKSFRRENMVDNRLRALRDERLRLIRKTNALSVLMNTLMHLVFSAGYTLAFGWSAYRIMKGEISYGTMTVFLTMVSQIQSPVLGLAQTVPRMIGILSSASRIIQIDSIPLETQGSETAMPSTVGLTMNNVNFSYKEEPVLSDINFTLRAGETAGVIGLSGVGKTTLIRLAMALTRPAEGGVVRYLLPQGEEDATAASRRFIAYVPQGNSLLSGTIEENLRDGREDATEQEMWHALELAQAAAFVRAIPEGLKASIKERAGGLSEGQAQRIAIARALIRRAPFLILDEATSALDVETEAGLMNAIRSLSPAPTCLMITHRKSLLSHCDRCFEIVQGHISECTRPTENMLEEQ